MDPPESALVLCVADPAPEPHPAGVLYEEGPKRNDVDELTSGMAGRPVAALEASTGRVIGSCKTLLRHQEFSTF